MGQKLAFLFIRLFGRLHIAFPKYMVCLPKYANNIQNAGDTLLGIINDVLDFSKIETGKIDIIESNYSLS